MLETNFKGIWATPGPLWNSVNDALALVSKSGTGQRLLKAIAHNATKPLGKMTTDSKPPQCHVRNQDDATRRRRIAYAEGKMAASLGISAPERHLPRARSDGAEVNYSLPGHAHHAYVNWDPQRVVTSAAGATPSHIVLAHELIHALHYMSGDMRGKRTGPCNVERLGMSLAELHEEARTIGIGRYSASGVINENAIRAELGFWQRRGYSTAGDLDNLRPIPPLERVTLSDEFLEDDWPG
jgi:hypothetical protein